MKKEVWKETYKKGTKSTPEHLDKLKKYIATIKDYTTVEVINQGQYDNGNYFVTVKIEY